VFPATEDSQVKPAQLKMQRNPGKALAIAQRRMTDDQQRVVGCKEGKNDAGGNRL